MFASTPYAERPCLGNGSVKPHQTPYTARRRRRRPRPEDNFEDCSCVDRRLVVVCTVHAMQPCSAGSGRRMENGDTQCGMRRGQVDNLSLRNTKPIRCLLSLRQPRVGGVFARGFDLASRPLLYDCHLPSTIYHVPSTLPHNPAKYSSVSY